MSSILSDDDRRAVDLLLDRSDSHVNGRGRAGRQQSLLAVAASLGMPQRIVQVASLLDLLNEIPACDVPADLGERTLRYIQETHAYRRGGVGQQGSSPDDQPVA